jgi:hypothetical protein
VTDSNHTKTYPRDRRRYQSGPDMVTAIGVFGKGVTLPMLAGQDSFTFGHADRCDLRIDEQYLAPVHARIDRIANSRASIRVTNVSSGKNEIVYNGEVAELEFEMGAGEWFEIGDSRYYALNEEMRLSRPAVMDVLGVRQHEAIDDLLIAAARESGRHILLLGETGCDQESLGRVIHQVSHRRHNRFFPLPERAKLDAATRNDLSDACNGSVLVHLHQKGKLDERLVAALVAPEAKLRLIICVRSPDKAEASFPAILVSDAKKIKIPPLRERIAEIPELLDRWFIARRSPLRFAALRTEVRESLLSHSWPGNLRELRTTMEHLAQLALYRSGRQATQAEQIPRGVFRGWLKKLNLKKLQFPLVSDKTD